MTLERRYEDQHDDDDRPTRRAKSARGSDTLTSFLLVCLGAIIAAAIIWFVGDYRGKAPPLHNPDAQLRETAPSVPLDVDEREAVDLFKKLRPSVVNVDIVQRRAGWDDQVSERQTGAGSGFIWDDDGRIVTNYHVIADLYRMPNLAVRVTLADRTAWDVVVVGKEERYDLAVLQFAPHSRPPKEKIRKIDLGTSHDLEVGQKVYAIGNPLGLSLTMTKGIISALDRPIKSPAGTTINGGIQTDAAINPGNSGGPLLDKSGRLVGVNTAIATTTENGGNIGIGFAIPADLVNQIVTQLVRDGRVLRPDLGIAKLFDQQKLRRARYDHGVMIESITPRGPADQAGLRGVRANPRTGRVEQVGDIILAINGEAVESHEDYERIVRKLKPGDTAKLRIARPEGEQEANVTVGGT